MHPDADYPGSLDGDDAGKSESDTFDPYLVSTVSATRKSSGSRGLSENMRVVVDELNTTATSRRATLLNSMRRS